MNSNNGKIHYTSFPSPIGRLYIAATAKGICTLSTGYSNDNDFKLELRSSRPEVGEIVRSAAHFSDIKKQLLRYFSGAQTSFRCAMDAATDVDGTDFQKQVWAALSKIPYGRTLTYREVAEKIGRPKAGRAVGNACGRNEIIILIPCHRVIESNGNLGGFGCGIDVKKYLLRLEGIDIK